MLRIGSCPAPQCVIVGNALVHSNNAAPTCGPRDGSGRWIGGKQDVQHLSESKRQRSEAFNRENSEAPPAQGFWTMHYPFLLRQVRDAPGSHGVPSRSQ